MHYLVRTSRSYLTPISLPLFLLLLLLLFHFLLLIYLLDNEWYSNIHVRWYVERGVCVGPDTGGSETDVHPTHSPLFADKIDSDQQRHSSPRRQDQEVNHLNSTPFLSSSSQPSVAHSDCLKDITMTTSYCLMWWNWLILYIDHVCLSWCRYLFHYFLFSYKRRGPLP